PAFNATSSSGTVGVDPTSLQMFNFGEAPLFSLSVFNFFSPSYSQSGPIAQAGLYSPEFQITTDNTVISSANAMQRAIVQSASNPNALVLNLTSLATMASNPPAMVQSLNPLLMGGTMSSNTENIVVNAVNQIPASNNLGRAQAAVQLLVT